MHTFFTTARKSAATLATLSLVFVSSGTLFASAAHANQTPTPVTVTIDKYIDGSMATATTAQSLDFPMLASGTTSGTPFGPSGYALSASGYNGDPTPYQAVTSGLVTGDSYTTNEDTSGANVGASCESGAPFALAGYTWGHTLAAAQSATPTTTPPAFTNLSGNKFVIVWNTTCPSQATTTPTTNPATGITASDATLNGTNGNSDATGSSFWVSTSTFSTASPTIPAGVYSTPDLGPVASSTAYSALLSSATGLPPVTASTTYYFAAWSNVGGTWYPGSILTFTTLGSGSTTPPSGDISGTVGQGTLAVTSITPVKTTATADGTYAHGWSYMFNITVPSDETNLSMKFSDWLKSGASTTIPVANNMQISSAQAASTSPVTITAANTYSSPALNMIGDLSTSTPGMQVQVLVNVAVPVGTPDGSYSTTYGVRTLP